MKVYCPESPWKMNQNGYETKPEHSPDLLPAGIYEKYLDVINQVFNHKKIYLADKYTLNIFSDKNFS